VIKIFLKEKKTVWAKCQTREKILRCSTKYKQSREVLAQWVNGTHDKMKSDRMLRISEGIPSQAMVKS
jgi:hypothetical protein